MVDKGIPESIRRDTQWRDVNGYSALHIACHDGRRDACTFLLKHGHSLQSEVSRHLRATPFMLAVLKKQLEFAKWLLDVSTKFGFDRVNNPLHLARNSLGMTAFTFACCSDSIEMAQWLYDLCGPEKALARDNEGRSPLVFGAVNASPSMMEWIADRSPYDDIFGEYNDKFSVLHYAAENKRHGVLKYLVESERFSSLNAIDRHSEMLSSAAGSGSTTALDYLADKFGDDWFLQPGLGGMTVLSFAAFRGKLDVLRWMERRWPGIMKRSTMDATNSPVLMAAIGGQLDVLVWLKDERDVHPLTIATSTVNATMAAAQSGKINVLEWLISIGCPLIHTNNDHTDITVAIECDQFDFIKWVYANHEDLLPDDEDHRLMLCQRAAVFDRLDILKWFFSRGFFDENLAAVLAFQSCGRDCVRVVSWLFDVFDPTLIFRDVNYVAPFTRAAANRSVRIMKLYLCSDCMTRDQKLSAVYNAARRGELEALKVLHAHGVSLTTRGASGMTPVMAAASEGHLDCVKWLMRHGCSISDRSFDGRSIIQIASNRGRDDVVAFITEMTGLSVE
jgi:ankyrin repeat protein